MQITVTASNGGVYPLDVSEDLQIMDLKALLEMETGIITEQMLLIFKMASLNDDQATLKECNIQEGDILVVTKVDEGDVDQRPHQPVVAQSGVAPAAPGTIHASTLPTIDWAAVNIPTTSGTIIIIEVYTYIVIVCPYIYT